MNWTGASLLALARALAPVAVVGAGLAAAAPAQAQSGCVPLIGLNILCPGGGTSSPTTPILDPTPVAGPAIVTLDEGFEALGTVALTTVGTAADVTIDTLGSATINTLDATGLDLNSGGAIDARITNITTAGDGATGAVLRAVDDVLFTVDDVVSTVGDTAPGLDIEGGTVSIDGNLIQTRGDNANGVELVSLTGPITLDADAIDTTGNLSTAALLRSAGATNVNVGVLRTEGSQALGLDIGTNPATCVLLGNNGCDVTAAADQISTGGFGGIGALVSAATGVTTLNVDVLQTGGDEAAGLDLSTNPTVCAVVGAGACDQNFNVGTLTTAGARSPGAIVRAAGNIAANVNLLTTGGEDAIGLDLASDPDACVLLGAGNCGTAFNVGQLTTSGAGATGVLARIVGPTTGRIDVLETTGDNATGIDIGADPQACALLGSGACDVNLRADQVTTRGDGAAAVLINTPANILANLGRITTLGDNATGLGIVTDPAVCLVLGPGACTVRAVTGPIDTGGDNSPGIDVDGGADPIDVSTGPINTGGDGSPGADVDGEGPITVGTGPVNTGGDNSPGVDVDGGAGPIVVSTGPVVTRGDGSPGVDVSGEGPINVSTGPVATSGNDAPAVIVDGGARPVVVDTTRGPITTSGSNADGIVVSTDTGDQTITAGSITVTGAGSDGIVATSPGCATVRVTATGPVSAAQGSGILASSACGVSVTTLAGAPVTGRSAGIDVTSGTGSTITIADAVTSGTGPAVNASGAGRAAVTIAPTGSVTGFVDLTDADDTLVNNGSFNATANSAFGGGNDSFANARTLNLRRAAAAPAAVTFTGLESFANNGGLIDMRNGATGDRLTLPGSFTGTGASTLAVDVSITPAGASADTLVIGGAASGSTSIIANPVATGSGLLVNGLVLVDAGAGSAPAAFTLAGGPATVGLVGYALAYDPTTSNYSLFGTPTGQAYELVKANEAARQIFYRSNDSWSGHMRGLRDAAASADEAPSRGSALWGQMFGSVDKRRSRQDVAVFGQAGRVALDHKQDYFGGQIGYDFGGIGEDNGFVFGITGGYSSSTLGFRGSADRFDFDAVNGGVYAGLKAGPAFLNLLGKYEHYWAKAVLPGAGVRRSFDGDSWGGKAEGGVRFGSASFYAEPNVAIEYARTSLDSLAIAPTTIDFASADGLRGSAGLRLGTTRVSGSTRTSVYASGSVVHEFKGRDGLAFVNGGQSLGFRNDRIGTFGRGVLGVNIASGNRVSGFIEANGDWSKNYKGGGGRAGISIRF